MAITISVIKVKGANRCRFQQSGISKQRVRDWSNNFSHGSNYKCPGWARSSTQWVQRAYLAPLPGITMLTLEPRDTWELVTVQGPWRDSLHSQNTQLTHTPQNSRAALCTDVSVFNMWLLVWSTGSGVAMLVFIFKNWYTSCTCTCIEVILFLFHQSCDKFIPLFHLYLHAHI